MKYDNLGCIVMEQCDYPGSVGDSAAETMRAAVLGKPFPLGPFKTDKGFLRHPSLADVWGGESDFSGDQLLPLLLECPHYKPGFPYITGTNTITPTGCLLAGLGAWRTLNIVNHIQGWLLRLPYRWSDDKKWFERTEGSSADFLNYAIIYIWLRNNGKWATMPHTGEQVMTKIRSYYAVEPNSQWLIELYEKAL